MTSEQEIDRHLFNENKRKEHPKEDRDPATSRSDANVTRTGSQPQKKPTYAELLATNAELLAKAERLEKERQERQEMEYKKSIARFIKLGIPELRARKGIPEPHEHDNYGADISTEANFIKSSHLQFEVDATYEVDNPEFGFKKGDLIVSDLFSEMKLDENNRFYASYTNEVTVQALEYRKLKDVLMVTGCKDLLEIFMELTIFALRPDLVEVKHPTLGVILIIEVKNPSTDKCNIFESRYIARQIYDYLKAMERTGHVTPFVLLTSYDKLVFARFKRNDKEYNEVVNASFTRLQESNGRLRETIGTKKQDCKPAQSPQGKSPRNDGQIELPPAFGIDDDDDLDEEEDGDTDEEDGKSPEVVYSQVFESSDVMKATILAVACGIESLKKMKQTGEGEDALPAENSKLDMDMPFVRGDRDFRWKTCLNPITYKKVLPLSTKKFFLISTIGVGNRGKVFLACNVSGKTAALKFYPHCHEYLEEYDPGDRLEKKKESQELKEESAKTEARRWREVSIKYGSMVKSMRLNDMWVVVMPYFAPVPKDRRLDHDVLQGIVDLLHGVYSPKNKKRTPYFSKEVRWGHIGCRKEDTQTDKLELTLLDLESLTPNAEGAPTIRDHVKQLIERSSMLQQENEVARETEINEKLNSISFPN